MSQKRSLADSQNIDRQFSRVFRLPRVNSLQCGDVHILHQIFGVLPPAPMPYLIANGQLEEVIEVSESVRVSGTEPR